MDKIFHWNIFLRRSTILVYRCFRFLFCNRAILNFSHGHRGKIYRVQRDAFKRKLQLHSASNLLFYLITDIVN